MNTCGKSEDQYIADHNNLLVKTVGLGGQMDNLSAFLLHFQITQSDFLLILYLNGIFTNII